MNNSTQKYEPWTSCCYRDTPAGSQQSPGQDPGPAPGLNIIDNTAGGQNLSAEPGQQQQEPVQSFPPGPGPDITFPNEVGELRPIVRGESPV